MRKKLAIIFTIITTIICSIFVVQKFISLKENEVEKLNKNNMFTTDVYFTDITFPTCNSECCENIQVIIKPQGYADEYNTLVITADNKDENNYLEIRQGMFEYFDVILYSPTTGREKLIDTLTFKYVDEDQREDTHSLNYTVEESLVCPISTINYDITKEWKDGNSENRPTEIEFGLYTGEGTIEGSTCTASVETNWKCTINQDYYDAIPEKVRIYENTNNNSDISNYYICENCQTANRTETNGDSTEEILSDYIEINNFSINNETSAIVKFTNLIYEENKFLISKIWNDNNNKLGKRPNSIDVVLKQNGIDYKNINITNEYWEYGPFYVPVYDSNGNKIEYTIEEKTVPYYEEVNYEYIENSKKTRSIYNGDTYKITNTLSYNENITISKKWVDGNNKNNVRPSKVEVIIYQNDKEYKTIELSGSTDEWTTQVSVPKYDNNQEEYQYTIKEKTIELENEEYNYVSSVDGLKITNTLNKKLTIKKKWQDNSNAYQTRPPTINIKLLQNNIEYKELTLQGTGNEWTSDVTVPLYNDSNENYTYTLKEATPSEYKVTYNGFTITNTLSKESTIIINKEWIDNSNKYNTRSDSIEVLLKQNGNDYKKISITSKDDWTTNEINVPKYDENGMKYQYSLEETKINAYDIVEYEYNREPASFTDGTSNEQPEFYRIINTLSHNENITITKKWLDGNNENNVRPSKVEVIIYQNDKEYQTLELSGSTDEWTTQVSVPKYDNNQEEYQYTIKEKTFNLANEDYNYASSVDGLTITNVLNKKITINKIWIDNENAYLTRPDNIEIELLQNNLKYKELILEGTNNEWITNVIVPLYNNTNERYNYTIKENDVSGYKTTYNQTELSITNTLTDNKEIVIRKKWVDNSNLYNTRPNSVEIILKQNEVEYKKITVNGTTDIWESIPIKIPTYDSNGKQYTYTIEESEVKYYQKSYDQNTYTITNTLKYNENKTISKKWLDGNNENNVRPSKVEVIIYQNDKEYQTLELSGSTSEWTKNIEVPKYDDNQEEYKYTVKEKTFNLANEDYNYVSSVDGLTITNVLNKKISITKKWIDNNNTYSTRPNSVSVKVLQNNSEYKNITIIGQLTNNEWKEVITVPLYDKENNKYKYTLNEKEIADYKTIYDNEKLIISNLLSVEKEIIITKEWIDNNNEYSTRPQSIKISLKQNGETYKVLTLSGNGNTWKSEKIKVPTYDEEGHKYEYTITEDSIKSYGIVSYNQNDLTVTNSLKENENLVITKKWIDNNNSYLTRPQELKITLLQNNKEYKEITLTGESNEWKTYIEVPVYDNNQIKYKYSIKESTDNLNSDYSNITYSKEDLSITNKLEKDISITLTKIWKDDNDKYKTRPSKININILKNGKEFKKVELTSDTDWKKTINQLPLYDEFGKKNTYTIEENLILNHYANITYDQTTYTITNEMTSVPKVKLYFNVTNGYTEYGKDEIKYDEEGFKKVLEEYNLKYEDEYIYKLYLENVDTGEKIEGNLSTMGTLEFDNLTYGTYRAMIGEDKYFDFVNMLNIEEVPGVTYKEDEYGGTITITPTGKDIIYGVKVLNKITKPIENPETSSGIFAIIIITIVSLLSLVLMYSKLKKEI